MEKGPQHISSIRKRLHIILLQYGKGFTIYQFNTEKCPHVSSIRKCIHNIISSIHKNYGLRSTIYPFNMNKGPTILQSNTKVSTTHQFNMEKNSTIYKFNMEKGPQYGKVSTIYQFNNMEMGPQYISSIWKRVHKIISSIRKRLHNILVLKWIAVHNISVQYRKVSTIYFIMDKGSTINCDWLRQNIPFRAKLNIKIYAQKP